MGIVILHSKTDDLNVSVLPGDNSPLVADTKATGLYQQFEVCQTDPASGSLIPLDFLSPGEVAKVRELIAHPPPPDPTPVPPSGKDEIDLSAAVFTFMSPIEVQSWPITANFTALHLHMDGNAELEFSKMTGPDAWPYVINMEGGEIQYTLWVGCKINSIWYFAACISCICRELSADEHVSKFLSFMRKEIDDWSSHSNYVPTGPTLQPGQLPHQWYYFSGWPLGDPYFYQPDPGEPTAWFISAGVARRDLVFEVAERTQVIVRPFSES